jgi:phosphoenolpyruvate carboxylase
MKLRIASRPASRTQVLSLKDLRAISWVFSWNQSRHGLPGWFGLGSALEAVVAEEGLARARFLYGDWPFFRALVDNARLALTQADLDVAALYAALDGARQGSELRCVTGRTHHGAAVWITGADGRWAVSADVRAAIRGAGVDMRDEPDGVALLFPRAPST